MARSSVLRSRAALLASVAASTLSLAATTMQVPSAAAEALPAVKPTPAKVSERPDRTSAMVTAIQQDSRVEDVSARAPSSSMFANPDGTWTVESYSGVVRSQTEPGEWVAVDPALQQSAAKSANAATAGGVEPVAVPFSVEYGNGDSRDLATVTTPEGGKLSVDWAAKLPEATVGDTTVTFANPGAGTAASDQVVVTSHEEGFNFSVELDQPPASDGAGTAGPEYRFPLTLTDVPGGRFKERADGTIDVLADNGAGGDNGDDGAEPGARVVATITAPVMWDSADEAEVVPVSAALEGTGASRVLVLRPDPAYLADPARVYPVTVDPTVVLTTMGDTWVQSLGDVTSQDTSAELRVGSNNLGLTKNRSYANFDISTLGVGSADAIMAAEVELSNFDTGSCAGSAIRMSQITSAWTVPGIKWGTQPTATATGSSTNTTAYGGATCAGEGAAKWDATAIVKAWVGGATNHGVQFRADNESLNHGFRKYRSLENGVNAKAPKLTVTLNQVPNTPTGLVADPGGYGNYVRSKTPTLSAVVTDPDGGQVKGFFEVKQGATLIWSGTSTAVASGGTASIQVPAGNLVENGTYTVNAYGEDDMTVRSTAPATTTIKVDTIAPTVTVSSAQFTNGVWNTTLPSSDTLTYTGSADTGGFWASYDGVRFPAGANSSGSVTVPYTPIAGWHVVEVTPVDKAGNHGTPVTFSYGAGSPAFVSPTQWSPSTASFPIDMSGPSTATAGALYWRVMGESTWRTAAQVKKSDGSAWTGTVTTSGGRSTTGALVWNATEETFGTGTLTAPAVVQVRGCFTYPSTTTCTDIRYLALMASAFGGRFPTTELGPATVALLSGEALISDGDAADSKAGIGRTFASLSDDTLVAGLFGPGWSDPLVLAPDGDGAANVVDNRGLDGSIVIVDAEGGSQTFVPVSPGSNTFKPLAPTGDSTELTLIPGSPDVLKLAKPLGAGATVTTWVWSTSDTGGTPAWVLKETDSPGSANDISVTNTSLRPTFIRQSDPAAAATCTAATQTEGCRALQLTYSGTGAATRVSRVERVVGASTPGAVSTKTLAEYTYTSGKLTKVCAPDPDGGGVATPLCTEYTYTTAAGRTVLATLKPAGLTAWRFTYDSIGRLLNVKRERPAASGGGDATWSIDYSLTTTSSGLPNMTTAKVAEWGQKVTPARVYAIYQPFSGTTDVSKSNLVYVDRSGATTNTASRGPNGWLIDTTWYDARGNTVQHLDAKGWARVQAAAAEDRQRVATEASSYVVYNTWGGADVVGTRATDQYGPAQTASLEDGTVGLYRRHLSTVYDDDPDADPALIADRPGTEGLGLVVQESISTTTADRSADYDLKTTKYGYRPVVAGDGNGWILGSPTSTSTRIDGANWATEITRYDSDGNVLEARQSGGGASATGAGNDARSTVTTYYSATGGGECGAKPAWAGQICTKGPAVQPPGTAVASTFYANYDENLNPTTVQERVAGAIKRTSTTSYDDWGRTTAVTVATSGTGVSADSVTTTFGYDIGNGSLSTEFSAGKTNTTTYDTWGRVSGYTDSSGNVSSAAYNSTGRIASVDNGATLTNFGYDDYGFLVTAAADGGIGTFSYSYRADGLIDEIEYPNGIAAAYTRDENGTLTGLGYRDSAGLLSFGSINDIGGRSLRRSSTVSEQKFEYDGLGRLTTVADTRFGACTTRKYAFSASSERTAINEYSPTVSGACQSTTAASTKVSTYDTANRITNSGYTYDTLGRTLNIPAADTTAGGASVLSATYRANDMVNSISQDVVSGTGTENRSASYELDAGGRVSMIINRTSGVEGSRLQYRYGDGNDSPVSVRSSTDGGSTWSTTKYASVPGLGLAAEVDATGVKYRIGNLHGDLVASMNSAGQVSSTGESDEYGNSAPGVPPARYGWLGAHQRSRDAIGGLYLMGARLYNPSVGQFTSIDPIDGGNATKYTYSQDPINSSDLTGLATASKRTVYWWGGYQMFSGTFTSWFKVWFNQRIVRVMRDANDKVAKWSLLVSGGGVICPESKVCKGIAMAAFYVAMFAGISSFAWGKYYKNMKGVEIMYRWWHVNNAPHSWHMAPSDLAWGMGITKKAPRGY